MTDPLKIQGAISVASDGLKQLNMYSKLHESTGDWSVTLNSNPFPNQQEEPK